jgi:hypothetical protein
MSENQYPKWNGIHWRAQHALRDQKDRIDNAWRDYERVFSPWHEALDVGLAREKGDALIRTLERAITKLQGGAKYRKAAERRRREQRRARRAGFAASDAPEL